MGTLNSSKRGKAQIGVCCLHCQLAPFSHAFQLTFAPFTLFLHLLSSSSSKPSGNTKLCVHVLVCLPTRVKNCSRHGHMHTHDIPTGIKIDHDMPTALRSITTHLHTLIGRFRLLLHVLISIALSMHTYQLFELCTITTPLRMLTQSFQKLATI